MNRRIATPVAAAALLALTAGTAAAERQPAGPPPAAPAASGVDVGFRVGGYGFKREGDQGAGSWTECRMNGVGVFVSRALRGPLFVEGGLDAYVSQAFPTPAPEGDLPIDRMSGLISVAAGARTQLGARLRGYVQLGAGVELTRVSVPYGDGQTLRDQKVMPEGFFGVGLDLRLTRGTYVGASFRTLVMGNFDYDPAKLEMENLWVQPQTEVVFAASPDLANQAQFYLRRDL
ncbi:MAG: outer membrane beta-barrel protein [Kofleriaceae bacterium]|nr:outer membrane beta-barrel protein [Kofleriaceae bacterium]MCL4225955.1 outer membrane beta-barrel protein [Myxococcales bacterium]